MKKRILSILLVLVMLVGFLPMSLFKVSAASTNVEVDTWDELEYALQMATSVNIKLIGDINHSHDAYTSGHATTPVTGTKTLDLNGFTILCLDKSNRQKDDDDQDVETIIEQTKTLFEITEGSTLTLNDQTGKGKIRFEADFIGYTWGSYDEQHYRGYTRRDIFAVNGTLIVNGGTIEAGSVQKQYVCDGYYYEIGSERSDASRYDGNIRQQVWGKAAKVGKTGTLVVNGGTLTGRGSSPLTFVSYYLGGPHHIIREKGYRSSVVTIAEGGKAYINGGSLYGYGGANVFSGEADSHTHTPVPKGALTVCGGSFYTDKHDNIRIVDSLTGIFYENIHASTCPGTYGNLGIPQEAYMDRASNLSVIMNGKTFTGASQIQELDLKNTGENYSVEVENSGWEREFVLPETLKSTTATKMEVHFTPSLPEYIHMRVDGGPYDNTIVADGGTVKWNTASSEQLKLSVNYTPYYQNTTGLENYSLTYKWRIRGNDINASLDDIDKTFTTTTNHINILQKAGITYNFNNWITVQCTVEEKADNLPVSGQLKTFGYSFRFMSTKTPLDESCLPGGELKATVAYPDYSGLNKNIVIQATPTVSQLNTHQYGYTRANYLFTYRDNDGEETEVYWPKDVYSTMAMDWGHVPVKVKIVVVGSDGIQKNFTDETWALKLPDITLSGGTWDSGKTVYTGYPGTPVTLKAPIDTINSTVAADKIVASDIVGWYKIIYNSSGEPGFSFVGNGGVTQQVTANGTYCYAANDRDGNRVFSVPVNVVFDADAYSISVTKSSNNPYWVLEDGTTLYGDTVLTATGSESVARTMVYWKVVSYPEGAEDYIKHPAFVNLKYSFTKNVSDFFNASDLEEIVPGNYTVQAFVKSGDQYITSSNPVTIEVRRRAAGADILTATGEVVSGGIIEGPYVGETMRLTCVPENGASDPVYSKGITWTVETLVGENVATVDNGVLTAHNPGQVKVTAKAGYASGRYTMYHTQSVIVNIPITEFEVTLGTPALGGDPAKIASVSTDAPYELVYNVNKWVTGVSTKGKFLANQIPELSVTIAPKDGYVFPASQSMLPTYEEWYTYADDCYVTVNGTRYKFTDFATTYVYGESEYGKDYGTWYEAQSISFRWAWERLRDPSSTYLDYVNLTAPIPAVDDIRDMAPDDKYASMLPICSNNSSIYTWVNSGGIYKVSGDYLNDNDENNDNAVQMGETETYQMGQMYRADIYFDTNSKNDGTFFAKSVTLMVNGTRCHIETLQGGTNLDGQNLAIAYYYFMPRAAMKTISTLYIDGIGTPVGYTKPVTAESITGFKADVMVGDEVYVSRLQWFVDGNNNNQIDSGEDSAEFFNLDGSFITGLRYSVYLELEAHDRDGDGVGDYVCFADDIVIKLEDVANPKMTGNHNGAVYKFQPATTPKKAVTCDVANITFNLEEGYTTRPAKEITFTSVGTTPVTSIVAAAGDDDLLNVSYNGMKVTVKPASGLAKGSYATKVYIQNESSVTYTYIPVIIHVGEEEATYLKGDLNDDGSVDNLDVEYLLWHTLFPDDYALNQDGDFSGDGSVDNLDVEYLLWHTLFPDDYPL